MRSNEHLNNSVAKTKIKKILKLEENNWGKCKCVMQGIWNDEIDNEWRDKNISNK